MDSPDSPLPVATQADLAAHYLPEFLGIFDLSGRTIYANQAALRLLGRTWDEVAQSPAWDFFGEDQRETVRHVILPTALREGKWGGELSLERAGSAVPVHFHLYRVDDPSSQPLHLAAVMRDLTEQKRHEAVLQLTGERTQMTLIATDVGTWLYEIEEDRVTSDHNMLKLSGFLPQDSQEAVSSERYLDNCHSDDLPKVRAALSKSLTTGQPYTAEYRVVHPDGAIRWVLARGIVERDASGKAVRLPGVLVDVTDRVLAQQAQVELSAALSRQEQMVQALMSSIPDFAYVFDLECRFIYANAALQKLWGKELPDIVGKTCLELEYPADLAASLERQVREVIATKRPVSGQTPYTSPIGISGYFAHIFSPIMSVEGSVELVAGTSRDITAQQLELDAVQRSEENFRTLAEALPTSAWTTDALGKPLWTNSMMPRISGVTLEEIQEKGLSFLVHPDDRAVQEAAWKHALETSENLEFQYRMRQADGGWRWHLVRGAATKDERGVVNGWIGTTTDIHNQRELQTRLEQSEAMFRQLADTMPQLAWMATPDGNIFWYNRRWYEYTGKDAEAMQGWGWQSVHDPDVLPHVMVKWQASIDTGTPFDMTFPILGKDQIYRPFLTRVMPLRNEADEIVFWFGTNTDISEQRRMVQEREELLASERTARSTAEHASRMKDEFLATLSHELRTPLNAIFGWTQLVKDCGMDDAETVVEAIEVIDRNVRVQTQLVDDLLDMSRIISGKLRLNMGTIKISDSIAAAIETVVPAAQAKLIVIEQSLESADVELPGDASRFQQIFWNLLSNAIKFTPKGGKVGIHLARVESHIEIRVTDDGLGIEPEFLPHVFDRFRQADASSTRKHGGLGLGLAIVKQLVELHGGYIRAESCGLHQGSTFIVDLPVTAVQLPREVLLHSSLPGPGFLPNADISGLKILLVDDELDARELLRRVLNNQRAFVTIAGSTDEAMELLRKSPPDVLISDIGMPGADGYELLRRVREMERLTGKRLPTVALTAFAGTEDRTRALLAGFLAHVSKPVEMAELVATIATVVGRTGMS